jgi:hypothetical protein
VSSWRGKHLSAKKNNLRTKQKPKHTTEAKKARKGFDPEVNKLIRHITSIDLRQDSDEIKRAKMKELGDKGPTVLPRVLTEIDKHMRSQSDHKFLFAGWLCETIGFIGGPSALDLLVKYLTADSNIWEYQDLRAGAALGLGHLKDPRAIPHLTRVKQERELYDVTEKVDNCIDLAFEEFGEPIPVTPSSVRKQFVAIELRKDKPDFKGLSQKLSQFPEDSQAVVWWEVAWELEKRGDSRRALKCFVQALTLKQDPNFMAWSEVEKIAKIGKIAQKRRNIQTVNELTGAIGTILTDDEPNLLSHSGDIEVMNKLTWAKPKRNPRINSLKVEAFTESEARQEAEKILLDKLGTLPRIAGIDVLVTGKKGFFGIGKTPHIFEVRYIRDALKDD